MPMAANFQWRKGWRFAAVAPPRKNRFVTAHIPKLVLKPLRKPCPSRKSDVCHSERSQGISRMKFTLAPVVALTFLTASAHAERTSLVGGTVINPGDGKILPSATVVINGDKIERV